ncbi:MAG: hemerythrin domain-containing protein [Cyclobacteriaceae bacterium]
MKRDPVLIPLSHDHHRILMCAQLIKADAPEYKGLPTEPIEKAGYTVTLFNDTILPHFDAEEKVVFPLIKGIGGELGKLADELIEEHGAIREMISSLDGTVPDHLEQELDTLGKLLVKHVRREERILFQRMQMELSEEQIALVGERLRTHFQRGN